MDNFIGITLTGIEAKAIIGALTLQVASLTTENASLRYLEKDCANLKRDLENADDRFEHSADRLSETETRASSLEQDINYYEGQNRRLQSDLDAAREELRVLKWASIKTTIEDNAQVKAIIKACAQELCERGSYAKINAIKDVRNITGCGLREAKDFVEQSVEAASHCKKCGSPLNCASHCTDDTCPYSCRSQSETFTEG